MTVQVYRLWPDRTWDLADIEVDVPPGLENNDDVIEARAVQQAWLDLQLAGSAKPEQIGLYMLSIYGANR